MEKLRDRILRYFRKEQVWINGGTIERLALDHGYKGSTASRELRQLHEDSLLERELRKGYKVKSVWYRIKIAPKKFVWSEEKKAMIVDNTPNQTKLC